MNDVETLTHIAKLSLYGAAFFSTLFVVCYLFWPWWSTKLGQMIMLRSFAFALAIDINVVAVLWPPTNHLILWLWINVGIFNFIAASNAWLTWGLFGANYPKRSESPEEENTHGSRSSAQ